MLHSNGTFTEVASLTTHRNSRVGGTRRLAAVTVAAGLVTRHSSLLKAQFSLLVPTSVKSVY